MAGEPRSGLTVLNFHDERFDAIDRRLDRLDDRFEGLQRTLTLTGGGIIATLIAGIVTVAVA